MSTDNIGDRKLRVVVLMGGSSSERPVSLSTGRQIVKALDPNRYLVTPIDTKDLLKIVSAEDNSREPIVSSAMEAVGNHMGGADGDVIAIVNSQSIESTEVAAGHGRADVVFIALHGKGGEDGTVQGLLEFFGLPYTGSGVLASALAMNKDMTKKLFAAADIPVIPGVIITAADIADDRFQSTLCSLVESPGFPMFVKPNAEGSTFGCTLVNSGPDALHRLSAALKMALQFDSQVLVEQYIHGVELTVGVLEQTDGTPEAMPVIEIVPKSEYYDYESKYADGGSDHIIPARLDTDTTLRAQAQAIKCHTILGCSGMSRTDMIYSGSTLYVLEVNTIPGMTATSLLPQAADYAGIPFPALLDRIIASAVSKQARNV